MNVENIHEYLYENYMYLLALFSTLEWRFINYPSIVVYSTHHNWMKLDSFHRWLNYRLFWIMKVKTRSLLVKTILHKANLEDKMRLYIVYCFFSLIDYLPLWTVEKSYSILLKCLVISIFFLLRVLKDKRIRALYISFIEKQVLKSLKYFLFFLGKMYVMNNSFYYENKMLIQRYFDSI